jgi:uncharacterized membrane protein
MTLGVSIQVRAVLAAALGVAAAPAAFAAGSYHDLGSSIIASGSSADGSVVGAYDGASTFYRWSAADGVVEIGGAWKGGVASVSADGSLISGSALAGNGNVQAATYDIAAGTWTTLGGLGGVSDGSESAGWNISADGQSVVGLAWIDAGTAHAVRLHGGSVDDLGAVGGLGGSSRANAVSADGSVVVGWQELSDGYWQASYWRDGTATLLYDDQGNALQPAGAVSADGTWIVGQNYYASGIWRHNTVTGVTDLLPDYDSFLDLQGATGISADGSRVVGYDRSFGPATWGTGTIWIDGLGTLNLTDYVTSQGVDLGGRTLALPLGISADGYTIYGLDNTYSGFVVTLAPVPEPASYALFGLGLLGIAGVARRRRQAA